MARGPSRRRISTSHVKNLVSKTQIGHGTLTLILKGEVSVGLTSLYLLVWNRLHQEKLGIYFYFQINLILTSKDVEVSRTHTSPFFKGESSLDRSIKKFTFMQRTRL